VVVRIQDRPFSLFFFPENQGLTGQKISPWRARAALSSTVWLTKARLEPGKLVGQ